LPESAIDSGTYLCRDILDCISELLLFCSLPHRVSFSLAAVIIYARLGKNLARISVLGTNNIAPESLAAALDLYVNIEKRIYEHRDTQDSE